MLNFPVRIDPNALNLGYAGLYSSFLLFAQRAEAKYSIRAREILLGLGRRRWWAVKGDMIEDTALTMARERERAAAAG